MLSKYYFTFGSDPAYPYYGGWVTVIAEDLHQAVRFFRARFNTEQLPCADYYTAEQFRKTGMYTKGNFGHYSHEVIGIVRRKKMSYYASCAIPKPGTRKKKKACNGYKDKKNRYCFYCGTPYAERHEVYGGANRQKSILNHWQVDLCHSCHEEMQQNISERAKIRNTYWRQKFQREYEAKLITSGIAPEQARDLWIKEVGRSYLDV